MASIALLFSSFALADDKTKYISLILFSSPYSSNLEVIYLNSLYKAIVATTTIISSHISLFGIIAALSCFTNTLISKK